MAQMQLSFSVLASSSLCFGVQFCAPIDKSSASQSSGFQNLFGGSAPITDIPSA
jgi:hypothetical protein